MTHARIRLWAMLGIGLGSTSSAETATFAYVANQSSSNVSVIDTATNTVVATILIGGHPAGVAITPDGKRAYVTNTGSDTISVIDTATNAVEVTVAAGHFPMRSPSLRTDDTPMLQMQTLGAGPLKYHRVPSR